jgi:hypothetical protein
MITGMLLSVMLASFQMIDLLMVHLVIGLLNTIMIPVSTKSFKKELGFVLRCILSGAPLMCAMLLNMFVKEVLDN